MPEGDAVRRTARRLDRTLAGREVVASDLRVPRYATTDLTGTHVLGTSVVGKHLLTRFDDGRTLHSHLRMDGRWATGPAGQRVGPGHQIRAVLRTEQTQAIGLRITMVQVIPTAREDLLVGHLGPDILAEAWPGVTLDLRPVGEQLLDQTVVAGLGTIWVSEACFEAGMAPAEPAAATSTAMDSALTRIRHRMQRAIDTPRAARYDVYRRTGQPCRRCGTLIRDVVVGTAPTARRLYYCPTCQPAG